MTASEHDALRVDLGALRTFISTLEMEIEAKLNTRSANLEALFFPSGRDEEQRPFGRSTHNASAETIGRAQHSNAIAHLDRLGQARDGLAIVRQAAQHLLEKYRDIDENQEITTAAIQDILDDIRDSRQTSGVE